tara:strand:+ start:3165 stop:4889 length:1725 start_codon:yes stop_codon:yes gene_type:complete
MNIFDKYRKLIIEIVESNKKKLNIKNTDNYKGVTVETPPVKFNYDLSCNISLVLAKTNNLNPNTLAKELGNLFEKNLDGIEKIETLGPGFINIKLTNLSIQKIIQEIYRNKESYGSSQSNKNYNIEFVSANPTGPLHVGHCRGAIYGDVLSNLLKFNGNNVVKEYYINDYGNQIINFTKSVFFRIREIKYKENFPKSENLYPGEYVIIIAEKIIDSFAKNKFDKFEENYDFLSKQSLVYAMELIKDDLNKLGVKHDNFFSEKDLIERNLISKTIETLKGKKLVEEGFLQPPKGEENKNWKKIKRLIFKSSLFGDDNDRALKKDDNTWTYFANDIAYHSDKVSRKYDHLINVLGADHTGYIKRISSAVQALSDGKTKLTCKVSQLVKLYKNGKPFKMSKRSGDFISVNDLLNEVDKDSIRFMMLNRSNDVELDFDFDKVKEKTKDNPVFYVQYCYARICSLSRSSKINLDDPIKFDIKNFNLNSYEIELLKKIFDWPRVLQTASKKFEPHRIPFYLYDLSTVFHSYWSKGNEDIKFRFLKDNKISNLNTLSIIKLLAVVIKKGMNILGVSLPNKM